MACLAQLQHCMLARKTGMFEEQEVFYVLSLGRLAPQDIEGMGVEEVDLDYASIFGDL